MPSSFDERRPPITPQLARRVAVLGGFAFVLFAIIFFRLWFLQVLSGETYVSQAAQNKVRKLRIDAPRGKIVDRNGDELVTTRQAAVAQFLPNELPQVERDLAAEYGKAVSASERVRLAAGERLRDLDRERRREDRKLTADERRERRVLAKAASRAKAVPVPPVPADPQLMDLFRRLGRVLELSPRQIHRRVIQQIAQTPYAAVTVKTDLEPAARNYLKERASSFPGVKVDTLFLREYPHNELAAHLFGTLREISPEELKLKDYRGLEQGMRIGKDGVEEEYDEFLRGEPGFRRQVVDALGQACDDPACAARTEDPTQGQQLRLTLDLSLQRTGAAAVSRSIAAAPGANAGAFVALDPANGELLALGSVPSFDANLFAKPISQERFDELNSDANGRQLFNRAIAGVYPTGSTFKLITATAALESGLITPNTPIVDSGVFKLGPQEFKNARDAVYGTINLPRALQVSSDVFFYILGNQMNPMPNQVLQTWARNLGLGRRTGIDIPGEFKGLVPDRKWRDDGFDRYSRCVKRNRLTPQTYAALLECGGIERPWVGGDNVNLAVGQGDLQATPLQMAVAYATLANGGKVVRPHLGQRIEDGQGRPIVTIDKPPRRRVKIKESTRKAVLEGLRRAAQEGDGTSAHIFSGFGDGQYTVYGKTGTVERPGQADQSWYVAFVTDNTKRPIVVAVTIERGGFGADTAAPAACRILAKHFNLDGDAECTPAKASSTVVE